MHLPNHLELLPGEIPVPSMTYADVTAKLFRIMDLFRLYDLVTSRAENASVLGTEGALTSLIFRKTSMHLSVTLKHTPAGTASLNVSLAQMSAQCAGQKTKEFSLRCGTDAAAWKASAWFGGAEDERSLMGPAECTGFFNAPPEAGAADSIRPVSNEQAFRAITSFVECWKSAE